MSENIGSVGGSKPDEGWMLGQIVLNKLPHRQTKIWKGGLPAEAPARELRAGGSAQAGSRTDLSAEVLTKADDNFPPEADLPQA